MLPVLLPILLAIGAETGSRAAGNGPGGTPQVPALAPPPLDLQLELRRGPREELGARGLGVTQPLVVERELLRDVPDFERGLGERLVVGIARSLL